MASFLSMIPANVIEKLVKPQPIKKVKQFRAELLDIIVEKRFPHYFKQINNVDLKITALFKRSDNNLFLNDRLWYENDVVSAQTWWSKEVPSLKKFYRESKLSQNYPLNAQEQTTFGTIDDTITTYMSDKTEQEQILFISLGEFVLHDDETLVSGSHANELHSRHTECRNKRERSDRLWTDAAQDLATVGDVRQWRYRL